jgi:hypothetical protein
MKKKILSEKYLFRLPEPDFSLHSASLSVYSTYSRKMKEYAYMPQVISASRRTDIPAFYADWLINRLKAGYVYVQHPYTRKMFRVSLQPEDVNAIVFWSKNYTPLLSKLESVERTTKNLYFHFTITSLKELETDLPDAKDAIRDYIFLAKRYSPEQIVWRYDPICITDKLSFEILEERFVRCADLLKGHARKCIISFVHPYKKVLSNFQKYSTHVLLDVSEDKKRGYALQLARHAEKYGIQLFACCNDYLVSEKIRKAACIDGESLSALFNVPLDLRPASSRKECSCTKSIDIGAYDTCNHGCLYCYATVDKNKAAKSFQQHDREWNSLIKHVDESVVHDFESQTVFKY